MNGPETAEVAIGQQPTAVAVTPDGRFGYATNAGAGTVSVVDLQAMALLSTIDLPRASDSASLTASPSPPTVPPRTSATAACSAYGWWICRAGRRPTR